MRNFTKKGDYYIIDEHGDSVRVGKRIVGDVWGYSPWITYEELYKILEQI